MRTASARGGPPAAARTPCILDITAPCVLLRRVDPPSEPKHSPVSGKGRVRMVRPLQCRTQPWQLAAASHAGPLVVGISPSTPLPLLAAIPVPKQTIVTTFNNGSLGSGIDEERSEMR